MRVVSLVPSLTETLFSLGLGPGEVVGVTRFCVHPAQGVAASEKVGGTKDPDVERILALRPDLVVANREENRREDVERLSRAGVRVLVTDIASLPDARDAVLVLGEVCDRRDAARRLADRISASEAAIQAKTEGAKGVPVYVPIWRRPWMTVGGDTYASDLLRAAGARNVFDGLERYPERSPEQALAAGAVAALLPSEPYPFAEKHVPEVVQAGFLPETVRLVDGEALTWYGARTPASLEATWAEVERLRRVVGA